MKFPCPQAECGTAGCPIATMDESEQLAALGLAEEAIAAKGIELIAIMTREQREELLKELQGNKPDNTPPAELIRKPDTIARIATAFHRHLDEPIVPKSKLKGY